MNEEEILKKCKAIYKDIQRSAKANTLPSPFVAPFNVNNSGNQALEIELNRRHTEETLFNTRAIHTLKHAQIKLYISLYVLAEGITFFILRKRTSLALLCICMLSVYIGLNLLTRKNPHVTSTLAYLRNNFFIPKEIKKIIELFPLANKAKAMSQMLRKNFTHQLSNPEEINNFFIALMFEANCAQYYNVNFCVSIAGLTIQKLLQENMPITIKVYTPSVAAAMLHPHRHHTYVTISHENKELILDAWYDLCLVNLCEKDLSSTYPLLAHKEISVEISQEEHEKYYALWKNCDDYFKEYCDQLSDKVTQHNITPCL